MLWLMVVIIVMEVIVAKVTCFIIAVSGLLTILVITFFTS